MSRKRNFYKLNPSRINAYNQFLNQMDKNANPNPNPNINKNINKNVNVNTNKNTNKNINTKEDEITKQEIAEILSNITKMYENNGFLSSFNNDNKNDVKQYNDPNQYVDFRPTYYVLMPKNQIQKQKQKQKPEEKEEKDNQQNEEPIIKETIHINVEINDISDILNLIHTYKNDPSIKYNIDINALHSIKEPLEELNNMVGMKNLKKSVVDQILYFIQHLHKNKNGSGEFLHTVIYGLPGTGKTEIAKIMGKIYSKIGILSKGTFKKVTRSDLVAGYLGQTALKTKEVIQEALGGVLFIDEAYSLGNADKKDSFSKECIDTLCEALSDNKENLMVIIAGYESELKECFFNYNQGLDSRFTWRFKTDEYTHQDLHDIFVKKVKDIGWELSDQNIGTNWFKNNKDCFRFYGRDIETLLSKTKIAHSRRVFCCPENEKRKITLCDLEKGFELYLTNEDIQRKREEEKQKQQLYNSLYC